MEEQNHNPKKWYIIADIDGGTVRCFSRQASFFEHSYLQTYIVMARHFLFFVIFDHIQSAVYIFGIATYPLL